MEPPHALSVARRAPRFSAWLLFGPAVAWLVVVSVGLLVTATRQFPVPDRGAVEPAGSETCARCHPQQHASWFASYHRTMTQKATGDAVLAPFAGESLRTLGFVATMTGKAQGRPHMRIASVDDGSVLLDVDVELTVGSHRYQQYVARIDRGGGAQERWRLPLAWHPQARRWLHLSGAFLTPDGRDGSAEDYMRHMSRWSDNCIFCHNTEPSPGLGADGLWRPQLAELGIACEACHGRASAHVAKHDNPLARVLTAWSGRPVDNSVAQPGRLDPGLHADVCGRCHGQRIAKDITEVMRHGDGFVPGQPLGAVSRPIFRDSELEGLAASPFADRFWPDGTPRLSAYEYQGLLSSECHDQGRGLSCNDCHTMHGEDPDGQLRAQYDVAETCGRCHSPTILTGGAEHGGHSAAVDCADCHMPHVTYGLLKGMMSHRITVPDPGALVGRHDQPDACTQCHVGRSRQWAAQSLGSLRLAGTAAGLPDEREAWASRVVLDLLGGDPVQRTLAAHALSRVGAQGPPRARLQALLAALSDEYPAVRWLAWRGLTAMAERGDDNVLAAVVAGYDFMAPLPARIAVERELLALLGEEALPRQTLRSALRALSDDKAIWIGE
ncbi:MAG: hypothetical protein JKY37_31660 [Nannocystaceae bacterium]|nr:hypothetical protein [Nannocystaceae bacterium]